MNTANRASTRGIALLVARLALAALAAVAPAQTHWSLTSWMARDYSGESAARTAGGRRQCHRNRLAVRVQDPRGQFWIHSTCMHERHAFAVALIVTASICAAQRTWIVDGAAGPGFDFTDLPPAFAAVADGDRVVVRPGSYGAATLTRAIQLVGIAPAAIGPRGGQQALVVRGIPAGKVCSIDGLSVGLPVVPGAHLQIDNCAGPVVLQRVNMSSNARVGGVTTFVTASAAVSFHSCSLAGGLAVARSSVTATDCSITFNASFGVQPPPTMSVSDSLIDLAQCRVIGSGGLAGASNGVLAGNSSLFVRKGCWIEGGASVMGAVPSIFGQSTTRVTADTAATMTPAPQALQSLSTLPLPTLTAALAPLGGSLVVTLASSPGDLYALFVAIPASPASLPFGSLWLQTTTAVLVGSGLLGTGTVNTQLLVPSDPRLDGLALAFQAVSGPTASGVRLSNPVGCVLGR